MDLHDYMRLLRRHWILVVASAMSGLLAGGVISMATRPTYTAETKLFVATQSSGSVQELQQGNIFSQARVQSYVETVASPVVLQPAIDALGLTATPAELAQRVQAASELNTVLIGISVSDTSPVQAAATARAVANSLIEVVDKLEKPKAGGTSPVSMSVIQPAVAPSVPSAPNTRINLVLGLLMGLALGVLAAVMRTMLDTRIRGEEDLRRVTAAPLLGGISYDPDATRNPLLSLNGQNSNRAESFRRLRTNLQFANISGRAKSVLITSSLPGEGKSTTATNLAIALAQAGQSVCLIDADLRRPIINEYLGLDRNAGLTTALVGAADVNDLLQHWGESRLYVLTSGQIPPNPSELLGSGEMKSLIERLEKAFDSIIIDAPPLLPVTDAAVLSQHVGGVIMVVGSQKLRSQDLEKSLDALELVGSNLLGIVLNRLPSKGPDSYSYGYYSREEGIVTKQQSRAPELSFNSEEAEIESDASGDFDRAFIASAVKAPSRFPGSRRRS